MKYIKILIMTLLCFSITNVYASTNTYTRTKEKPLVPENIVVNDDNIEEILKTPSVSAKEKIYDFGEIYTKEQEEYLYQKLNDYVNDSTIDVVIVTTRDLNKLSIDKYSHNFYVYNDFNKEGIIFVISLANGEPEIYMGNNGPEGSQVFNIYTSERIEQILKYLYSDIKSRNYFSATEDFVRIVDGFYKLDRKGNYRLNSKGVLVKIIPWFEVSILAITLTFIIIVLLSYGLGANNKLAYSYDNNINNSTMMVKFIEDDLIETKIGKEK